MDKQGKALVVFSGGLDSTTCLYHALRYYKEVDSITFDYGQRNAHELESATKIAELAGVHHEIIYASGLLHSTSPLIDHKATLDAYRSKADLPYGIDKTFVPMRNAFFITIAYNRAVLQNCDGIILGFTNDGGVGYPDTRANFAQSMQEACCAALGGHPAPVIYLPLGLLDKPEVVKHARRTPGCWEALYYSYTCYRGEFPPCGTCRSCVLRARAFAMASEADPLQQRADDFKDALRRVSVKQ